MATLPGVKLCLFMLVFNTVQNGERNHVLADGNIALGKAAFQTSTNWDADGPASRAVDGNTDPDLTNGKSCTHTNGEDNASWWVDLGQAYMVDRVVIYNRMDWGPERLNPFNIHIGDSDQVSANPMCGGNHQIDVTKPSMSVPCPGMRGRYLGVRLPGSNRKLSLCEVKIFPGETPGAMAALTTTQSPPTTLSVSTATTPGQKTAYGCRHEYLQLSCAEGETLWVLDANFGRTSTTHPCSSCNNCPTDCRAASSLSVVRSACQGQRQCSVLAHHSVFGDPCSGINKYLEASYRCITGAGWLERSAEWVITATKTSYPNSGGPDKVLDGDSESHWNPVVSDSWFITFDLGVPHTLSKISLTNFGDTAHDILNFRLQTSLVSSPYVWKNVMRPAETNVAATANPQEFGDLSFTGRFWRFNVTKTHGALQPWLRELNFFGARLETDCFGAEIAIHYGVTLQFCADACCAASSCLSFQYNSGSSCYLKTKLCSGAEKVYTGGGNMYDWFVGQGDGHWSQWGSWSGCDVTCGIGNQLRSRSCDNPPPVGGGANCIGDSEETRTCDTGQPCPVDGNWSQWTSWSGCDATCGFGKQSRSRRCDNPSPLGGGAGCAGESEETQVCVTGQPCPVNGNWSLWTSWSSCDVTCGFGNQSRNRSCDNPPPQHGGANCTGTLEEFRTCDSGQPCAVDGNWSLWTSWSSCDVTCGFGNQSRNRSCDNPPPQHGGANCTGTMEDIRTCDSGKPCAVVTSRVDSGTNRATAAVTTHFPNMAVRTVLVLWRSYAPATVANHVPLTGTGHSGLPGPVVTSRVDSGTNRATAAVTTHFPNMAVRTVLVLWRSYAPATVANHVPWTSWSSCDATCGFGNQLRNRSCDNPPPQHGGANCTGTMEELRTCDSGKPCAVDGKWSVWSSWSTCNVSCGVGYQTRNRSCDNPEPQYGGANCTGISEDEKACDFLTPCPVDGGWSPWTSWSNCSETCGNGSRNRSRRCDLPLPQHGGANCTGDAKQSQACGQDQACYVDGVWSAWSSWSTCITTCGLGSQARNRTCSKPLYGGANCTGVREEVHTCTGPLEPHCPTSTAGPTVAQTTPSPDPLAPSDGGTMEEFTRWETGEALPESYDAQASPVDMSKADSPVDSFSTLEAKIHFKRRLPYYILRVYIPTATVVAVSWMSFWVHYSETSARVGLGCTTFLMLVRLGGQIEKMPHISYIRAIDLWYVFCLAFSFLVILEYAVVHHLHNPQNRKAKQTEKKEMKTGANNRTIREKQSIVVQSSKCVAQEGNQMRVRQASAGRNRIWPSADSVSNQPVRTQSPGRDCLLVVSSTSKHTSNTCQRPDDTSQEGEGDNSQEEEPTVLPTSKRIQRLVNLVRAQHASGKQNRVWPSADSKLNQTVREQPSGRYFIVSPTSKHNYKRSQHQDNTWKDSDNNHTQEEQLVVIPPTKRFVKTVNQVRSTLKEANPKPVKVQPSGWELVIPPTRKLISVTSQRKEGNSRKTQEDTPTLIPPSEHLTKKTNQVQSTDKDSMPVGVQRLGHGLLIPPSSTFKSKTSQDQDNTGQKADEESTLVNEVGANTTYPLTGGQTTRKRRGDRGMQKPEELAKRNFVATAFSEQKILHQAQEPTEGTPTTSSDSCDELQGSVVDEKPAAPKARKKAGKSQHSTYKKPCSIDEWSRVIFPVGFLLFSIIYWVYYLYS
uniref:F5/8 type C domain-containing protein n=1 Tax=Branchiostoma floridae TaxID=7739 RepID=C3XPW1_BRAFL|eukprot:XP_002613973.1 hypothetical protein BRAFLDRAFT_67461 [Branchiostoma floridae]